MSRKSTTSTVPKRASERQTEDSHRKLAEDFIARLDRSWQRHGRDTLDRLRTERPAVLFKAIVKLAKVLHCRFPEPPEFDRQRARAEVLQRAQELAKQTQPPRPIRCRRSGGASQVI
jgi:hypothetical protein